MLDYSASRFMQRIGKQDIVFKKDKATLHVISKDVNTQNISNDLFYLKILQQENVKTRKQMMKSAS